MTPEQHQINELEDRLEEMETRVVRALRILYLDCVVISILVIMSAFSWEQHAKFTWLLVLAIAILLLGNLYLAPSRYLRRLRYSQKFLDSVLELNQKK